MQNREMQKAGATVAKWISICEQLPEMKALGELRALTTVYYPIALLRMKLAEHSFEDFNAIEQSMLRFVDNGVYKAEEICRWMALPSVRYVQERLALLRAEGLLTEDHLTPLGERSLKNGQKIQLYDAEQIFQADGLTGLLLPREYQIKENFLTDRAFTAGLLPHLAPTESLAVSKIQEAIEGPEKIRAYKRYRKSILNVNVEEVQDVKAAGIKYTKALLVWPMCSSVPMVFLPYYKRNEAGSGHHCDMPLFIPASLQGRLPNLSEQIEVVPDSQAAGLVDLYKMIIADQNRQEISSITKWIDNNTVFAVNGATVYKDRILVKVECPDADREKLAPLDLEIAAALGSHCPIAVEAEMDLSAGEGRSFKKRLSIWPYSDHVPEEVRQLSAYWSEYSWRVCKAAPLSLKEVLACIQKKQSKEDD